MIKPTILFIIFLCFFVGIAQEASLPADLRQHALTQYNASLFNPTFSLDRNNPQSVSFWTRWQWQNIDADPTTLFLNYTREVSDNSVAAIGFFQHNTGIFFNTGGVVNYAYEIEFNRLIKLSVGANVFGFVQEFADDRFQVNPIPGIPQTTPTSDFILQVAPGVNLTVENFSMSLASENLFDYNFGDSAANTDTSDKIFMGLASYDFPVIASDSTAYLRPSIYLRTIPEQENQIGMNALFSTQKYWAQAGFNNFYGISVGAGGTILNKISLGALVEFGTSGSLNSTDPSFELVASYFLGKPEKRRKLVASGIDDLNQEVLLVDQELTIEQMREELRKAEALANSDATKEETVTDKEIEQREKAEVADVKEEIASKKQIKKEEKKAQRKIAAEQKALEKQQRKDSIAIIKKESTALALEKEQEEEKTKLEEEAKDALVLQKKQEEEQVKIAAKETEDAKTAEVQAEAEKALTKQKAKDSLAVVENEKEAVRKKQEQIKVASQKKKEAAVVEAKKIAEEQKQNIIAKEKKIAEVRAIQKAAEEAKAVKEAKEKATVDKKEVVAEEVTPQAGEKYQEVATEDGLEPGFYLIANVFGTKKYFDAFMKDISGKGLQPKSFFRSANKYNYAYLDRYATIGEARRARDSKFDGKYPGKTWIFRVVGK